MLICFVATITLSTAAAQQRPDQWVKETSLRDKGLAGYSQDNGILRGYKIDSILAQAFGIYQPTVTTITVSGNPVAIRNKIVKDARGYTYAVDFYGNSRILTDTMTLRDSFTALRNNLLVSNNTWTGKNTFADFAVFNKGLRTLGTANSAAVTIRGVQKSGVHTISANTTIDGTYNTIIVNTSSGDVNLTLPSASSANVGWQYKISKTGGNLAKIIRPAQSTITLYSTEFTITIKNNSTTWEIE